MCRADNLATFMCWLIRNSGSLNVMGPKGPVQACNGIAIYLSLFLTPVVARQSYWSNVGHGSVRLRNSSLVFGAESLWRSCWFLSWSRIIFPCMHRSPIQPPFIRLSHWNPVDISDRFISSWMLRRKVAWISAGRLTAHWCFSPIS